ncbi:hypothetical protein SRB17_86810 [Streptomyces sp. RB17]|uniref:hypothetical protein n=1 Tax=Streptomyces sp. RB17 TaxID=2585197 RepID=UPI001294ED74|nr:hypothetical protein [Streptomyces sp. RB17]MQY40648.1 hypothetical protein [Streptomyces sp. RB17]
MSPSTGQTSWMGQDNEVEAWMRGRTMRPVTNRGLYLRRKREQNNAVALETPVKRKRRIIAYALTEAGGQVNHTMAAVRHLIAEQGYDVVHELTDVHAPHTPLRRPGWAEARRLVGTGFADGIAALNREAVSLRDDEYEEELRWLGDRPALLLLVIHEAAA